MSYSFIGYNFNLELDVGRTILIPKNKIYNYFVSFLSFYTTVLFSAEGHYFAKADVA